MGGLSPARNSESQCGMKKCALTMHLHEIIFCATSSSSPASGSGSVTLHDISTGASLASFKQTNAFPHCTTFLTSKNAQGGFIFAAQPDKSLLHAYNFQKDQISLKIVLPEKLTCVALDSAGDFFAGGTLSGRIYLWEVRHVSALVVYFSFTVYSSGFVRNPFQLMGCPLSSNQRTTLHSR